MTTPTWDQLTFLTPAQQTKAAQFAALGQALALFQQGKGPPPDYSTVTQSQCKQFDLIFRSLVDLTGPAVIGEKAAKAKFEADALAAFQAANP